MPAIFLDRDGTLIHDRGYLRSPDDVVFYSRTIDALKMLQKKFGLFIISNQSGIAKGMQSIKETEKVNRHIINRLMTEGIKIKDFYYCPHKREDNCHCMKPKPYFAQKAAAEHGISLSGSFSIGDHPHDVELARNFGGAGVYVLTGHGRKHVCELRKDVFIAKNILAAANYILNKPVSESGMGTVINDRLRRAATRRRTFNMSN
jgi:histidinol-phosphate phosphatase family protein